MNIKLTKSLGRWRPFGLALGPSGLLDFDLHALRALRPCDPCNGAMIGQCVREITEKSKNNRQQIQNFTKNPKCFRKSKMFSIQSLPVVLTPADLQLIVLCQRIYVSSLGSRSIFMTDEDEELGILVVRLPLIIKYLIKGRSELCFRFPPLHY